MRLKLVLLLVLLPMLAQASLLNWGRVAQSASGRRQYARENYLQAEQTWGRLTERHPDDGRLQYNHACALYRLGRHDEALAGFRRALTDERFKGRSVAWQNIGRIHAERLQYREAWSAYRQSLLADPANETARSDFELIARELITLRGNMFDADSGQPLTGVTLRLVEQDEPPVASGRNGSWLLHRRCEPGTVTIEAVLDGYVSVRKRVETSHVNSRFNIPMQPVLTVHGTVRDAQTGEPIAGAQVLARGIEAPPDTTSADGAFTLPGFAARTYAFEVNASGYLPLAQPVEISRADTLVELAVQPAATLRGIVVDSFTGQPVANAEVRALESAVSPVRSAEDGTFNLDGLEQRKAYTISVFAEDYAEMHRTVTVRGEEQTVQLALKPGLPLSGRVLDATSGEPVAYAVVFVDSSSIAPDTTAADGVYRLFGFDEATYRLMALAPGYAGVMIDVTITRTDTTLDIPLPRAINVSGIVFDADTGAEIEGALVRVPGWPVRPDTTSVRGFYRLDGLWEGEYPFQVTAPHYFPLNETHEVSHESNTFDFRLHINITVRGAVFDADTGQPIEDAKIEVHGVENSPVTTDFEGRYSLSGFREQAYTFQASAEEYQPVQEQHEVDRANYVFDFYLRKADQQEQEQQEQEQNQDQDQDSQNQDEQQEQEQEQEQQQNEQQNEQQQSQQEQQQQSEARESQQQQAEQEMSRQQEAQQKEAAEKLLQRLLQKEKEAKEEEKRQRRTTGPLRGRFW
ncbi:MAG: carboxypeptidase regulatory-like domain-containing protein [Candidatus Cloacimonetes bacterium]|nr:carboxypeptidase regulatory-like domain-containing protein [Candidatus Cloacimonadota bacterium]